MTSLPQQSTFGNQGIVAGKMIRPPEVPTLVLPIDKTREREEATLKQIDSVTKKNTTNERELKEYEPNTQMSQSSNWMPRHGDVSPELPKVPPTSAQILEALKVMASERRRATSPERPFVHFPHPQDSEFPSERASDRASERAIERSRKRAIERASDRAIEKAIERATDLASERSSVRAIERASDRASNRASERSSERAIE